MSIKIMNEVIEHAPVEQGALLVLIMLADSADEKSRECWPSVSNIAKRSRLSERQVQYCLRDLAERGMIQIETNAGRSGTNLYRITPVEKWVGGAITAGGAKTAGVQSTSPGGVQSTSPGGVQPIAPEPSLEPSLEPSDLFGSIEPQRNAREEKPKDRAQEFWDAYPKCPRKVDRLDTLDLFRKIVAGKHRKVPKTDPDTIIEAVRRFAASGADPEFMPMPSTWLGKARWEQFPKPEIDDAERRRRRLMGPQFGEIVR